MSTYYVGITDWVVWADVEDEPRTAFHRLAKYPGADEKDLNTVWAANDLPSRPEMWEAASCLGDAVEGRNEVDALSLNGSTSASSAPSLICFGSDGVGKPSDFKTSLSLRLCMPPSCELPTSSSRL